MLLFSDRSAHGEIIAYGTFDHASGNLSGAVKLFESIRIYRFLHLRIDCLDRSQDCDLRTFIAKSMKRAYCIFNYCLLFFKCWIKEHPAVRLYYEMVCSRNSVKETDMAHDRTGTQAVLFIDDRLQDITGLDHSFHKNRSFAVTYKLYSFPSFLSSGSLDYIKLPRISSKFYKQRGYLFCFTYQYRFSYTTVKSVKN